MTLEIHIFIFQDIKANVATTLYFYRFEDTV